MGENKIRNVSSTSEPKYLQHRSTRIIPAIVAKAQSIKKSIASSPKATPTNRVNLLNQRSKNKPTSQVSIQMELEQELKKLQKKLAIL